MTRVRFFSGRNGLSGFSVEGHSSFHCDDEEGKLVCAAVSSAVYLTANTLTDILGERCEIGEDDARFTLRAENPSRAAQQLLRGLRLHFEGLSEQYPKRITILTEV